MAGRFRWMRGCSRFLPHLYRGTLRMQCCRRISSSASAGNLLMNLLEKNSVGNYEVRGLKRSDFRRFTTVVETVEASDGGKDLLTFIESCLDKIEGPSHWWLNKVVESEDLTQKDGIFLVIAGLFHKDSISCSRDDSDMMENVKKLQQIFPRLKVMGFQSGMSKMSDTYQTFVAELFVKDYVSFPIMCARKEFPRVAKGKYYLLFKDFSSPALYMDRGVDIDDLYKAVKDLSFHDLVVKEDDSHSLSALVGSWHKPSMVKEPCIPSLVQNLVLCFPGCISVDDSGNRIFLSDSNHHRIIILDGQGVIQDCIGSFPGFEDGEFESAKLFRPAGSYYEVSEDCLYFVDSENHAIRRADMKKRVIETIYPSNYISRKHGLWPWIKDKVGLGRGCDKQNEDFDSSSPMFPWHLMKSVDGDFLILNRSFGSLWIMSSTSGEIKEVVKGPLKISEICGRMIMDKVSILEQFSCDWQQLQVDNASPLDGIPYSNLLSSFGTYKDDIIVCDTVGQQVLKCSREAGFSNLQFSNLGILGLPYWLACTFERVYTIGDVRRVAEADHIQSFELLPGQVDIQIIIDIPQDTELAEPVQDGCIWRQARGPALEISGLEPKVASKEKISSTQQWYDELDTISLLSDEEDVEENVEEEQRASTNCLRDDQVCIKCTVKTSPGVSEVIVYAALYLKLKSNSNSTTELSMQDAERITAILDSKKPADTTLDPCFHSRKLRRDLIFTKPLHIRLLLHNLHHPKAPNGKDTILTDSSIKVNVSLNS